MDTKSFSQWSKVLENLYWYYPIQCNNVFIVLAIDELSDYIAGQICHPESKPSETNISICEWRITSNGNDRIAASITGFYIMSICI